MKNILITGGAGFIGSNLTKKLVEKEYVVTILDNLSEQIHGNYLESALYNSVKDISNFIKGDVRNKADWKKALQGQNAVIHLAAETGTGQSMYDTEKYNNVNVEGTKKLIEILENENHQIQKILIASSRAIYGEGKYFCKKHGITYPEKRKEYDLKKGKFNSICEKCNIELQLLPTDEKSKIHPLSHYGETKYQQEKLIMEMGEGLKISAVSLRYQNVYGPGQSLSNPYTGILSIFSTRILNGNNIDIYEDGQESRDFVFIDDVIDATILALENNKVNNEVFNVGSGVGTSIKVVAKSLKEKYNGNIELVVSGKFRIGDIRHNIADLTKVNAVLGYKPQIDFKSGISKFVDWVKTQKVQEDKYEDSIEELKQKGLIK
jgi:dTDP-L-rhamnose 4-epimerase